MSLIILNYKRCKTLEEEKKRYEELSENLKKQLKLKEKSDEPLFPPYGSSSSSKSNLLNIKENANLNNRNVKSFLNDSALNSNL